MASSFNGLTPEETELLAILAEECGEVTQRVGKIIRHGRWRVNPYDPNGPNNTTKLEDELGDIYTLVYLLGQLGVLDYDRIVSLIGPKIEKLRRPDILHHSSILRPRPCRVCGSTYRLQYAPGEDQSIVECVDRDRCEGWAEYCRISQELHEREHQCSACGQIPCPSWPSPCSMGT